MIDHLSEDCIGIVNKMGHVCNYASLFSYYNRKEEIVDTLVTFEGSHTIVKLMLKAKEETQNETEEGDIKWHT